MSCMSNTSVPTLMRLHVHEKAMRVMVVMWCTNISQKSLRRTSKNCEKVSDQ